MSEKYVTEKMLDKASKQTVDEITGVIKDFIGHVDSRFEGVDARFDRVEQQIVDLKESHNRLLNTVDGFIKRLEDYEVESRARDHEMERIRRWVEQIASKTGVQLEY